MTLPNFLLVGAQKAGTTAIWFGLRDHPQVFLPDRKELMFFSYDELYKRGTGWYSDQFAGFAGQPAIGEGTPCLHIEGVAERIASVVPEVKLVISLRDPVERAYSAFCMQVLKGSEPPGRAFVDAVADDPSYLLASRYLRQLQTFERYFPRSQLHIIINTDLRGDSTATWDGIHDFIGVDRRDVTRRNTVNQGGRPRFRSISGAVNMAFRTRNLIRQTPLRRLVTNRFIDDRSRRLRNTISGLNRTSAKYPPLSTEVRATLISQFVDDIDGLESRLNRDLSAWKTVQ